MNEPEPIVVPVPRMLADRSDGTPRGLYKISVDGVAEPLLVAETDHGYIGFRLRCPHMNARLDKTGTVNPTECTVHCQTHLVTYSLETGDVVTNESEMLNGYPIPVEELGNLLTFNVDRVGDRFIIHDMLD